MAACGSGSFMHEMVCATLCWRCTEVTRTEVHLLLVVGAGAAFVKPEMRAGILPGILAALITARG